MAYTLLLALCTTLVLLDAFVIPRALEREGVLAEKSPGAAAAEVQNTQAVPERPAQAQVTQDSYQDGNITITLETLRAYDTTVYLADIRLASPALLRTALAQGTYGRNIKATTSEIAQGAQAVLAINGDYYGFRDAGYVLRNGQWYRQTSDQREALVVDWAGDFSALQEGGAGARQLLDGGAWQVLSFGPVLVSGGAVAVEEGSEISGKSMNSNPRTAMGQVGPLHYLFLVSDGRTEGNAGLSLYQLAQLLQGRGCTLAYNLDGGGSSSMVFMGQVVNQPVSGGRKSSGTERAVSDIVYIGYP